MTDTNTNAMRDALQALLDWGRDHTGPDDPHSPHALLIAAAAALEPNGTPAKPATPKITMVCSHCGGRNVMRDAWAEWCDDTQDWVLGNVFDAAYCDDCDGETHIEEEELTDDDEEDGE